MPGFEQFLRVLLHDRGIAFNLFFMEGRLHRPALLAMFFAIDGQQSFTGAIAFAIILEHAAIREMARVFHQDVAHVFRAEEQHGWILPDVDGRHVAIGALELLQKAKWVLSQWEKMANIG